MRAQEHYHVLPVEPAEAGLTIEVDEEGVSVCENNVHPARYYRLSLANEKVLLEALQRLRRERWIKSRSDRMMLVHPPE